MVMQTSETIRASITALVKKHNPITFKMIKTKSTRFNLLSDSAFDSHLKALVANGTMVKDDEHYSMVDKSMWLKFQSASFKEFSRSGVEGRQ
jgi:hypothetical protein